MATSFLLKIREFLRPGYDGWQPKSMIEEGSADAEIISPAHDKETIPSKLELFLGIMNWRFIPDSMTDKLEKPDMSGLRYLAVAADPLPDFLVYAKDTIMGLPDMQSERHRSNIVNYYGGIGGLLVFENEHVEEVCHFLPDMGEKAVESPNRFIESPISMIADYLDTISGETKSRVMEAKAVIGWHTQLDEYKRIYPTELEDLQGVLEKVGNPEYYHIVYEPEHSLFGCFGFVMNS